MNTSKAISFDENPGAANAIFAIPGFIALICTFFVYPLLFSSTLIICMIELSELDTLRLSIDFGTIISFETTKICNVPTVFSNNFSGCS